MGGDSIAQNGMIILIENSLGRAEDRGMQVHPKSENGRRR